MVCGLVGRDVIFTRRDLGYVCVILKYPDIVQLLNAPLPVVRAVHLVCQRLRASCILRRGDDSTNMSVQDAAQRAREDTPLMHKYGCSVEMALGGYVFVRDNALRASAVGKQFTMKLFATMDELGYDFFLSSNLSTARGGCGAMTVKPAWFFVHRIKLARRATKSDLNVTIPRSRLRPSPTIYRSSVDNPATPLKIVCIEPRAHDQLHLFGADESVIEGVKMAIADAWPKGIKSEIREVTLGGDVILLQLHGFPWFTNREDEWEHPNLSRAHVNVQAKRLLVHIVGELARIHYKYVTATNLIIACALSNVPNCLRKYPWSSTNITLLYCTTLWVGYLPNGQATRRSRRTCMNLPCATCRGTIPLRTKRSQTRPRRWHC
eukprot:GEMP01021499.1.p1 GENE.GEMP01021499.1~~GEMP01021499.1.p1  ORF type:complete len:378 (+),score=68.88 GEMP01021499.1:34-1167(+)